MYNDTIHRQFLAKLLERLALHSAILIAACGAGRFEGMLLEVGMWHNYSLSFFFP